MPACSQCHKDFTCSKNENSCWCFDFPLIMPLPTPKDSTTCLCPKCLQNSFDKHINTLVTAFKKGEIENPSNQHTSQTQKSIEGIDYYIKDGLTVFTAWYLLKQNKCCHNGCLNCPYQV